MNKNPEYDKLYTIDYIAEKSHSGIIYDELTSGYSDKQMYIMANNDFVSLAYADLLEDISDVAEMKPDGAAGKALKDKMIRYDEWQSIYSKYGEGLYAVPYADSIMGWVYDHDTFLEKNWYIYADLSEKQDIEAQGITCKEGSGINSGLLEFVSSTVKNNYSAGDIILSRGKDGKYGIYDDGQPITVEEWEALIRRIGASGSKAFIAAGGVGSYAQHIISGLFAQYSGLDDYNTYFTYNSNGKIVKLNDGTETEINLENEYLVNGMEGIYKAYEFASKYYDARKNK